MKRKLTDRTVRCAKPKNSTYSLADGGGLQVQIKPNGSKLWRYNYRHCGKQKTMAVGRYPDLSLAEARDIHTEAHAAVARGEDPSSLRKVEKAARAQIAANTFRAISEDFMRLKMSDKSEKHRKRAQSLLDHDFYPAIGDRPISEIGPAELLRVLRKIEARGAINMAHRAKGTAGMIFRFAVASGLAERDIAADLTGALEAKETKHYAAITDPRQVGHLLLAIDGFEGTAVVHAALRLLPLIFCRPGEMRSLKWEMIDWELDRIAYTVGKTGQEHVIPLSRQAKNILIELTELTSRSSFVFPSARGPSRCMSDNALRTALRALGFSNEQMTAHGFRAMARTLLDEALGFRPELIEHQLAHQVRDPLGRAYNRTRHLDERKEMMQQWADYLDELRQTAQRPDYATPTTVLMEASDHA